MDNNLQCYIKDLALKQLADTPVGLKLQQAVQLIQNAQAHIFALAEKQDELGMTGVKVATMTTFAILRKIADGKKPSELNVDDWKEIAAVVSEHAILRGDQQYSVFIFGMYERYIRYSATQISDVVPQSIVDTVNGLADELHSKAVALQKKELTEVAYTEDCLWISLEAMVKLLASTVALVKDDRLTEFAQAAASYAFEYGRLMLYRRELEIVDQFIESQYQLDAELEQKYAAYLEDLQKESQQFYTLIDNAFAPNFRDAFLHSILLARASGVKEAEILTSAEDIDSFFLN